MIINYRTTHLTQANSLPQSRWQLGGFVFAKGIV